MNAMGRIESLRERALEILGKLDWLTPLLGRLAVGLLFMLDGWAKLHNIDSVTSFFAELAIPAPHLNALVVSYSQLICGAALVVGLLTRLATVPLIVSMAVAILTAKLPKVHGLYDFVGLDEFTYLVVCLMIALLGPGAVSLDALLVRRLGWSERKAATAG
jgi:putative oxidoreductase